MIMTYIFGILLIIAGAYLPWYAYRYLKEKAKYRLLMFSLFLEFGMIAIALGGYLISF